MAGPAAAGQLLRQAQFGGPGVRFPSSGADFRAGGPENPTLNQRVQGSSPWGLTAELPAIARKTRMAARFRATILTVECSRVCSQTSKEVFLGCAGVLRAGSVILRDRGAQIEIRKTPA